MPHAGKKSPLQAYWADRASKYANLDWAKHGGLLMAIVHAACLARDDVVLDAGTGTGLVARSVDPYVEKLVVGLDISPEMMNGRPMSTVGDIRQMPFPDAHFSKVFARMVFHGLMDSIGVAARECHRVLRPGGRFILVEGIPPSDEAQDWFTGMFRLKEERIVFCPTSLKQLLLMVGFSGVSVDTYTMPQVSVRNWLENSSLSPGLQDRIMEEHFTMPASVREAYRATYNGGSDAKIDMKFAICVGEK